jgi:hypothetical protein
MFDLTKPLQKLPYSEVQLNSTDNRCEVKDWMSHGVMQHVCGGYSMTHYAKPFSVAKDD